MSIVVDLDMPTDPGEPRDWIEVRLLGVLRVRRADGTLVLDREWRTTKNLDLLRWLALEAGNPVPVEALLEGLWPGVDDTRARASLRTAVSHLRRVLGPVVERVGAADVVLGHAWVDTTAFAELAEEVGRRRREGLSTEALSAAREADALYMAKVPVGESAPPPIAQHSAALATTHRKLLGDAAEVAVELGWMRDAVDYATRLLEVDPVSERASRALMLGHSGIGELHHALGEYERCRQVLADELGVDPSAQTRAVHLQVLQPSPPSRTTPVLIGRRSETAWLESVLAEATAEVPGPGHEPHVVVLGGRLGSGRRRLATAVCQKAGLRLDEVGSAQELVAAAEGDSQVLLWGPEPASDLRMLTRLLSEPRSVVGCRTVILVAPWTGEDLTWDRLPKGDIRCLELEPLLPDDVGRLAAHLLAGPVTTDLVDALITASHGLPGGITATVRQWASAGKLLATGNGLALAPAVDGGDNDQSVRRTLSRVMPRLDGDALDALLLAAVLDQPVTPSLLASLLPRDGGSARARATTALEQLVDLQLLRHSSAGAIWRHPRLRDAVHGWMRPAVRRRLHRRIAEQAPIASASRIEHWLGAGERELACVAALEAAAESSARGDYGGARTHLLEVCSLGDVPEAATADRVDLFERLGDACALLRRPDEARSAYEQALEVSRANSLPDSARLRRKLNAASDPRVLELAPRRGSAGSAPVAGVATTPSANPDAALEASLLDAVAQADRNHDQNGRFQSRLELASAVYLPRREFRAVHEWIEAALALGPRPDDRLRATVVRHLPAVLLGRSRDVRQALDDASAVANDAGEEAIWWRLLGMRVVVAHDIGDPAFASLWAQLHERVTSGPLDELVPELATIGLRVLVEREELDLAVAMAQHLSFAGGHPTMVLEHLARIAAADLAEATGEHRHAADLLRFVIDGGLSSGCTLLVPEAAARLVAMEAAHDPEAARAAFEVCDEVVGAAFGGPREEFWRRMARAAVRAAQGDFDGAVGAATQASALAAKHGLQVLASRGRRVRAEYVRAGLPRPLSVVAERHESAG